ncbi:hypothetical protein [Delftia tsuruhatensis]|uniref:hypothetical protein n=1 Tax=Delftia tsuruhatensis TaxID=180282 RepID=UPI000B066A3F|nr:hypothetical protein [Delftia tsuruhatensis]
MSKQKNKIKCIYQGFLDFTILYPIIFISGDFYSCSIEFSEESDGVIINAMSTNYVDEKTRKIDAIRMLKDCIEAAKNGKSLLQ